MLQAHPCVLPPASFSSRSHPRRAGGGRPAQYTDTSITVNCYALLCAVGTERQASPAAGSGSEADAEGSQVQALVRPGLATETSPVAVSEAADPVLTSAHARRR